MSKIPVYLVFGPQGSGKSTQAELLSEHLKLPFFDSGSQLREMAYSEKEGADKLRATITGGNLVSNGILRKVFDDFIKSHDCSMGLVTDGFPRNMVQVKLFENLVADYNWEIFAFYVDISDTTAKKRLLKRYKLIDGRKVFREDDKPATVEKRLALFKNETVPVIDWLKENHVVYNIDGEPSKLDVFNEILSTIKK